MKNGRNLSLLALTFAGAACSSVDAERPNLLIIHTDEHSFRTLSCYQALLPEDEAFVWGKGCNSTTPNIDRIANEGAICMRYYASTPVSTPSRASLVTGLYPNETGAWHNGRGLRRDVPTFASLLRDNGYSTSYVGKWHLSHDDVKYTFRVGYAGGFEDSRYMMNCGHSPFFRLDKDGNVVEGGLGASSIKKTEEQGYDIVHMTDFFTDKTLEIIERDKDKPFCIMLSIPDPHTPDYALPEYYDMYKDMEPTPPISIAPEHIAARPLWANTGKNETDSLNREALKHYFGMVSHIDDSVGRLLEALEQNGVLDNTIVIFTADHGEMFSEHGRKNKGNPYEGSTRVPFVIRYPKTISAGRVITKSYSNVNFAPTILSMMGIKSDARFTGVDDSQDFLTDQIADQNRFIYISGEENNWAGAVDDRYKLVLSIQDEPWLVDLINDPHELINIYNNKEYEAVAKRMQEALETELYGSLLLRDGVNYLKLGKYSTVTY